MAAVGLGILGGGILGAAIAHAGTPVVVNPAPVVYSHPLVIASSAPQQTLVVDQVQTMVPAYGKTDPLLTMRKSVPVTSEVPLLQL